MSSCEYLFDKEAGLPVVKKVYAPGELKADEIERIALSEVGKREGMDVNFRSDGVQDQDELYYVSIVARPYRADGRRTVVVNDQGDVVEYYKGNRLPKYSGPSVPKKAVAPVSAPVGTVQPASPAPGPKREEGAKKHVPVLPFALGTPRE